MSGRPCARSGGPARRGRRVAGRPQDLGDPAVHPGAAQLGQVGVQGVAHQRVREADPARRRLAEQPGDHAGLQRVEDARPRRCRRRATSTSTSASRPDHRGQSQHRHRRLGQPGEAAAQHVAYPLGHLGERDQRALARQQPGALPHVERVAAGALGQRGHRVPVDRAAVHRGDQRLRHRRCRDRPGRSAPASGGPARPATRPAGRRVGRPVRRQQQHRRPVQIAGRVLQQRQRLPVGAVQVVEHHRERPPRGRRTQPARPPPGAAGTGRWPRHRRPSPTPG